MAQKKILFGSPEWERNIQQYQGGTQQIEDERLAAEQAHPVFGSGKGEIDTARGNQAALESAKQFGGNVADTIATGLNYANPVTFAKNLWDAAGQFPAAAKAYDKRRGEEMRANLARSREQGKSPFATPTNDQVVGQIQAEKQAELNRMPPGNAEALAGNSTGPFHGGLTGLASEEQLQAAMDAERKIQRDAAAAAREPMRTELDDYQQSARDIFERDGIFNDANVQDYLKQTGYRTDAQMREPMRDAEGNVVGPSRFEQAQKIHRDRSAAVNRGQYEQSLAGLSPAMRGKMLDEYDNRIADREAELAKQSGVNETAIKKQKMITDAAAEVRASDTAKAAKTESDKFTADVQKEYDGNIKTVADTLDDPEQKRLLTRHAAGMKRSYERVFERLMKEKGITKGTADLYKRGMSLVQQRLMDLANDGDLDDTFKYGEMVEKALKDLI